MPVRRRVIATVAALCFATAAVFAQNAAPRAGLRTTNAPPKPTGTTPRTADGHPDLTGVWNGLGDNLNGVPNQIANNGIAIESETVARDLHSGQIVAVFPRLNNRPLNNEQAERAAALLRRSGSNRPIYKPEYWDMVTINVPTRMSGQFATSDRSTSDAGGRLDRARNSPVSSSERRRRKRNGIIAQPMSIGTRQPQLAIASGASVEVSM